MNGTPAPYEILVRVARPAALLHTLDASPFRERDLDADAEEFILGWAEEAPGGRPISIVIELPASEKGSPELGHIEAAIHNNFAHRADGARRELRELFREGRRALVIGMSVLALCLFLSQLVGAGADPASLRGIVAESAIILGWVANWRPLEIFLYGWWPIVRQRALFRRIAVAPVTVRFAG